MKDQTKKFESQIKKLTEGKSKEEKDQLLRAWEELATNGDVETQYLLGLYHEQLKDYERAITWYQRAMENKYPEAINALGYLYLDGKGVDIDVDKAFELFSQAADEYDLDCAYFNLSKMYLDGDGCEQNTEKGMALLEKSMELGDGCAALMLGRIYLKGLLGFNVSYRKAAKYFEKGFKLGNFKCIMYLLDIYAGLYSFGMQDWKKHKKLLKIYDTLERPNYPIYHETPIIPMDIYKKLKKANLL